MKKTRPKTSFWPIPYAHRYNYLSASPAAPEVWAAPRKADVDSAAALAVRDGRIAELEAELAALKGQSGASS